MTELTIMTTEYAVLQKLDFQDIVKEFTTKKINKGMFEVLKLINTRIKWLNK